MKEYIQSRVQEKRTELDITQQELAEAVGVTRQTIFAIEKGRYTPSVALALKIADYFDTTVEDLFQLIKDH